MPLFRRIVPILSVFCVTAFLMGCDNGTTDPDNAIDISDATFTSRSANCIDYANKYTASSTDIGEGVSFEAELTINPDGSSCVFTSNAIPNHDFNATGNFATRASEQNQTYSVPANPVAAVSTTPISLTYDNAVMLNGVKLDLLAAGCFGVGDGNIGCNNINTPYRYDPMGTKRFGADEHNAHTQPDGTYHYHGNPKAMFQDENATAPSPVIGFAADGFPIFGSYISDGLVVRKALSSYRLKSGTRPSGTGEPGGTYDGTFVDDWEYVANSGDLDQCNGMTIDGVYGYFVTDTYPHVLACFTGTPDSSFQKGGFPGIAANQHAH